MNDCGGVSGAAGTEDRKEKMQAAGFIPAACFYEDCEV